MYLNLPTMGHSLLNSSILQNAECIETLYVTYCSALSNSICSILIAISIIVYIITPIFISLSVIWMYVYLYEYMHIYSYFLTFFSPLFEYRSVNGVALLITISSIYGLTHSRFDVRWMNKWMASICHSLKLKFPIVLNYLIYILFSVMPKCFSSIIRRFQYSIRNINTKCWRFS